MFSKFYKLANWQQNYQQKKIYNGQVNFELGQVTFQDHLPNEQAPGQNPLSPKWYRPYA